MNIAMRFARRFAADRAGAGLIETALVVPILAVLSLGGLEVSQMVARNTELKSALAEAAAITLAKSPTTQGEIDTIEAIVEASTGLHDEDVSFVRKYRCGVDADLVDEESECGADEVIASYLEITVADTYDPAWTGFGVGSPVNLSVTRTVQVS